MTLQEKVRELLKANGMNVKSLIEKSNVPEATIHHFLRGENITLSNLNKIAETFGMKVWFVKI